MRLWAALCFASVMMLAPLADAQIAASSTSAGEARAEGEHAQLARRFVSVGGAEAQFVEAAINGFEVALPRYGINLTDAQLVRLRPTLTAAFQEPARIYVDEMTGFMARTSSTADLQAAIAYYESAPGRAYAATVVEMVTALALFGASGGRTELPAVPEAAEFNAEQLATSQRLAAAFSSRLTELEVEQLAAGGVDAAEFVNWMARFVASRLQTEQVEAAARWAESPESQRLEGPSAERAAAEQLAALRATRAIDLDAIRAELDVIRRETPA